MESQVLVLSAGTAFSVSIDLSWTVRVGTSPIDCQTDVFRGCTATINNIDQLSQAASLTTCEAYKKLVMILIDNLVYEKQSKKLVGFVNLGDINTHLLAFERSLQKI